MADTDNNVELGSVIEFSEDISKAEAPPPLPPRSYVGTITGAVPKVNKNGGKYASVQFTISPDQFPPDFAAIQADAVRLSYNFVPLEDTAAARYRLKKFCEAIRSPVSRRVDLNDFIGKSASVVVQAGEYNGEPQAQIKTVEAL